MNETIKTQLNHRSIRAFQEQELTKEEVELLVDVARHTATSKFMQAYSIISITDPTLKAAFSAISKQPYVENNGHLFLFVVDYHRNVQLTKAQDRPAKLQETADYFIAGLTDATIAAQTLVVAAASLGIGTVFLGSLHNDAQQIIDLLGLPEYTFPAVGLAVGWPNQEPQLKPRLPKEVMHMENHYQVLENPLKEIEAYDEEITSYYDTRDLNHRVDRFSKQVADKMETLSPKRLALLEVIQQQGFLKK